MSGRTLPGFAGRQTWLCRAYAAPAVVEELAEPLAGHRSSRWVRVSRDRTELMCGLVTRTSEDAVLALLPSDPRVRRVALHDLLHVWGGVPGGVAAPEHPLDELDQRLMAALARDGRAETRALARSLGVDPSTVSRRRRRLLEEGVLYLEADIHPAALGAAGDAMAWLKVTPGGVCALGAWLHAQPECRFVAACDGEFSLVCHVLVPDQTSLLDFVDERLAGRGVSQVELARMGRVLKRNAV